jgi:predicted NAD-dependent protein-ADP-ribosyltransferase YbiA (DUF1768 family)
MCPYPDDNSIVNQNTNPVVPLTDEQFAARYKEGSLPGQELNFPEGRFTNSGETFSEITSGSTSAFDDVYEQRMKELEKEVVKEDYDNLLTGGGKLAGQLLYNVAAMVGDFVGLVTDPGDIRLPTLGGTADFLTGLFGYKTDVGAYTDYFDPFATANEVFKAIDNYTFWGDGEDETGNMWTRDAQSLRDKSQHFFQINTSNDYFDVAANFTIPIIGSVLGAARTGQFTAAAGQIAGLSKGANAMMNSFIMTESTGLSIAQGVHNEVYREVLNKLSNGELQKLEDKAYSEAFDKAVADGYNKKDAEWLGIQATKQARTDFATANPELGKEASKNAGKGADVALKSMAPSFALNMITGNMYTRSLYSPKNILSKPKWIQPIDVLKEIRNEVLEESGIEQIAEKAGIAYGTKGTYNFEDLKNTIVSYDALYSGIGAIIGGGGGAVFSSLPYIGDFNERKKQYDEQQEVLVKQNRIGNSAGLKDMIDNATTLTMDLGQVVRLGKEAAILEQLGMKEEANMIKDKMLSIQAHEAFKSGTTKNLIENYEKIASNPNAGPEVQLKAREAVAEIKQMGEIYEKTKDKYINDQEVYSNKINEHNLNKVERQLETEIIQKKLEADIAIKLELESGRTSLTSGEETIIDNETGNVVTQPSQLNYNVANLKVNPYVGVDKDAEVYRNFSEYVTNNVQAVRELNELEQRLGNVKQFKKDNFERYNKITSKAYQKSLRYEQKLARVFDAGEKELEELKGTNQYMPLVDAIMEKYKGKIDEQQFKSIRKYYENQNNTKKVAEDIAKEEIKKNEFAKSETEETEVTPTDETSAVKPEGSKAMLENIARKLSSGEARSIKKLTKEEQDFYMNNQSLVDKRTSELKNEIDSQSQTEITEDEELSQELQNVSNEVSSELDGILGSKEEETESKPLSNTEVKNALQTPQQILDNKIQALENEKQILENKKEEEIKNLPKQNEVLAKGLKDFNLTTFDEQVKFFEDAIERRKKEIKELQERIKKDKDIITDYALNVLYSKLSRAVDGLNTNQKNLDALLAETKINEKYDKQIETLNAQISELKSEPISKGEVKDVLGTSSSAITALEEERKQAHLEVEEMGIEGSGHRTKSAAHAYIDKMYDEKRKQLETKTSTSQESNAEAIAELKRKQQEEIDKNAQNIIVKKEQITWKDDEGKNRKVLITHYADGKRVVEFMDEDGTVTHKERIQKDREIEFAIGAFNYNTNEKLTVQKEDIVFKSTLLDKINAKYNAQITVLEGKPVSQETNVAQEIEKFINRVIPNQEKRLLNAQEIASNGKTFNEAIDNLIKKSENARNKANERLKKEAAKEGVKPLDIQERLAEYKETKEADRYDYLIEQINEVYAVETENFNNSTQEAIDYEQGQLDIANKRLSTLESQPTEVKPDIILSGLAGGFKGVSKNSFDVRNSTEVMNNVNSGKSFSEIVEYKGKKYVVVGLRLDTARFSTTVGRDNYSFAVAELNENTPNNIVEILETSAKENFKNIYSDFNNNDVIRPITEQNKELSALKSKPTVEQKQTKAVKPLNFVISGIGGIGRGGFRVWKSQNYNVEAGGNEAQDNRSKQEVSELTNPTDKTRLIGRFYSVDQGDKVTYYANTNEVAFDNEFKRLTDAVNRGASVQVSVTVNKSDNVNEADIQKALLEKLTQVVEVSVDKNTFKANPQADFSGISLNEINPTKQQEQVTLSQKEQEILNSFKDNKASKPLLNRKFAANKSEIESLLAKGIIKEDGNNYVIAGREAQEVTLTVQKTKAEQVADNLLAKQFTRNAEGTYNLQINLKALSPEEKADIEDAVKVIKERIKNNQLDGWEINKVSNPLFEVVTITKPNLTSNQPMEEGDVSYQPDEIPTLTKEQEEKIKDLIESYVNTMEIDNNKFPTFEELVKSYIRTVGKEKAEKHLKLLGTGWELNGYGTISDYNAILRKLFGKREDIALGISAMSEELSQSVAAPEEVEVKQDELIKKEEIKDSAEPIDVTPDKQVVYSTETDIVSDTSPKLGYSVFDFSISQKVRGKDGKIIVTTDTINEGLKKKQDGLVKAIKTANFENVKVGAKLTVSVNPLNELNRVKSWVIPARVEDKNSPLYGTDVLENGKVKTIKFGEWLDQKVKESGLPVEEFMETQEFWDRVPILVSDEQGDFIAQVHDIGWYTPAKFNGDIKEAKRNVNEIRKLIKEAFKRGENSVFEITNITGGKTDGLKLTELVPLKKANPQAMMGLIVKDKDGNFQTFIYENGKRKEVKVENLSVITGAEQNKTKSMMKVDIRRWGTDADGKPTYKAFYSTSPKLSASQVNTVKNIIYSKLIVANNNLSTSQNNKFGKLLNAINSTIGSDITNNESFTDLLKRFVFISPVKNVSQEYRQGLINKVNEGNISEVENTLATSYFKNINKLEPGQTTILSLAPDILVVAKNGSNGIEVKIINKNTIPVENNEIVNNQEFLQRDALLQEALQNSLLNGYAQVGNYKQPVIQVNNDFTLTTVANNYPEFVQNNVLTNLMSVNVGTNDKPVYATRLQSNIYYKPVGTAPGKSVSRKEGQTMVSDSKVTEKDKQAITNVVESTSDEAFEEAVEGVEQDGFELFGDTVEEKAEDLKEVVKQMSNESKEIVENHLEAGPNLDNISEYNEFLNQASNKVKWVNEYFNEDNTESAESLESNQPREIGEEDVEDMAINLLRINGVSSRHQSQLANYASVKLGDILSTKEINQQEVRDKVVEDITNTLNANKESLQETLAQLKSIPQYQDRPKVMELVVKYETALNKINLVLDNIDVIYKQSVAIALKDLNGKVIENDEIEVGDDPNDNDLDNQENEEDVDDELSEEEDRHLGTENYSKTSLEVNPKASITSTLRRFMRGIPDISPTTGLPKSGAMGVTTYVDFDTVYDVVQSLLADAPVDFNMMMDILEVNKNKQPWLPILINKLKESSSEVKNQFTTTMGKHALTMEFLMYSFDKEGNATFKIVNTNLSSINRKIKDEWSNNLTSSNVLIDEYGNVSRDTVDELLNEYNSWMKTPSVLSSVHQRFIKERLKLGETSFNADENNKTLNISVELAQQKTNSKITNIDGKEYLVSIGSDDVVYVTPYERNIVSKALVDYASLTPAESKEAIEKIKDWFDAFGIELTDNAIDGLFKNPKVSASQFFEQSNNFAVGSLVKWLDTTRKAFSQDKEVTITEGSKNNPLDNSAVSDLAYHQSKYSSGIVTSSFRDGKKSIYGFTAFKFITDRANEIKNKPEFRDNLRKLSFSKNSFWLQLFEDGIDLPVYNFKERFNVTHLGLTALKEFAKKLYRDNGITSLGDVDHELVKVGMHQADQGALSKPFTVFGQQISLRNITALFPTMSDKSTMTLVKTLGLNLTDKKYFDKTENGKLVPNKSIAEFIFEQTVLPEIERVINFNAKNPNGTDIKNYDKGAKMLLLMPHLNDLVIFEKDGKKITLNEAINTKNAKLQKVLSKKDVILAEVQNYVSALVEEKMKVWAANGYYTVEEKDGKTKVTNNLLDKKYMEGVVADSQLEKIELAAMDFEINQMLSNANAFMTMIGDPAIYYKADSSKSFIQQSKETFTNVGKRLALMIAPGSKLADSETEQYTQVMLEDRVAMSENISFLTEVLDNKKFDWKEYNRIKSLNTKSDDPVKAKELKDEQKKQFEEFYDKYPNSNGYFNIEGTDAQEYTTWQEHLHILEKLGRLNDATVSITPEEIREAKEMFANNTPYSQMSDKQKGILKKVLQPIKPVYTGQIFDEAQDVMRTVYIKSSSFPLIPQVTEGTELNKLKEALEALQKEGAGPNPSPYKYVRASYQSANKVGAKAKALNMYEDDGSIKDLKVEDLKASSLTLNRKDFKIQLDVPYKSFKKKEDTVSLGTQLTKILFGNGVMDATGFMYNGKPIDGVELEKEYTKAFIELVNYKTQQLYDELGIDIKTNKPIDVRATAAKLQNILKTEAINRGYSKQDVEALEVIIKEVNGEEDLTFKLPLWLAANANRFESLLNAVVNNRIVKLKFPGSSFVAGSEEGFKIQKDFKGVDKNKIVWTKNWNGKELQAAKYDADGNLQYAQVIAPSKFRKKDGTLIDLLERKNNKYVYVTETKQGFKLKEDMIDPELRNITAFRIPTSGHMSAAQVEIVGFLPNEQGDLMIVPKNLTKQKGLDFDVDKENTYSLWHETDENGKITVLKEGDKEKLLQNEIIKIHTAVLSNPDKEVQKKINNILSIDYAKEQAENIDSMISSSKDETYFTPLGSEYQKNKMFLGASGKIGIGAYSLDVTTHSLFEQAKAKGNQVSLNYTDIDEKGKTIANPFNMSFEGEGRTDGTLGNQQTIDGQRTIAQVLSELQNIATDNEKEQVMGRVNLNSYTLDVSKILAMLGFDKAKNGNSIQFTFLSQPIIREYVKEMDNVNSNVAKFNPNKESAVINKLLEKYGNKNYELGYDVDVQNTKNFTMDKMENQLRGEVDNDFQLAVLNRFLELKKLGLAVRTLQGAINTDSKGLGKSILDNSQKIESINNLLSNPVITNAGELLGNFIPIVKYEKGKRIKALSDAEYQSYINDGYVKFGDNLFLPTTVSGVFTARALVTATSLWDRHFPYNSKLFNSIFENLMPLISKSEASDAKKVEKKSMVIKEIKRFLNSYSASNTLFDNINAQAERERLFFDRPSTGKVSLATYIKELKKANSSLASNKLIERLELVANTQGEPSLIKFNNTSAGFYDENGLNNALLELMELNLNLPSFNNEPYTSRKLAQDLITYSYLEGGVQEATQFVKFIPLSYLNKMGFTFGLSNIDFDSMGAYSIFDINPDLLNTNSKFITQFVQHNPGILPKLDNYIPKIGDIKNISEVTEFNIEKMLNAIEYQGMTAAEFYDYYKMDAKQIEEFKIALANKVSNFSMPEFVALRKDGEYLLWKSAGNGNYVQVPVVQSGISEYDSNVQQITPLSSEIVTPQNPVKEQPLSPSSDESKVTNETRFGLGTDASLTDIVTNLANSTSIDEYLITLAKQLLPAINPTTSITVDNIKTRGKYKRAENAITISASQAKNATDTELARTILKELMHSITDNELGKHVYRSSGDNKYYLKSSDAPKHISVLINLFNQVSKIPEFENAIESIKKKLAIEGQEQALTPEENRIYYGAYDVYEFVEMMMTQPEFQQEMAKIKTGNGKSVLDLFKNFLNTLFKNLGIQFETGTVASEAIENILILVDEKGRLKQQPTQTQLIASTQTESNLFSKDEIDAIKGNYLNADDLSIEQLKTVGSPLSLKLAKLKEDIKSASPFNKADMKLKAMDFLINNEEKLIKELQIFIQQTPEVKPTTTSSLPGPETKINIYAGTRENAELSNFAIRPFTIDYARIGEYGLGKIKFQSVEQAFQYIKFEDLPYTEENVKTANEILKTVDGAKLRQLGKQFKGLNKSSWDNISSPMMKQLIQRSFEQNPDALQKLLATGNATLTHKSPYKDDKWTTEFPKLLMEVREELKGQQPTTTTQPSTQEIQMPKPTGVFTERLNEIRKIYSGNKSYINTNVSGAEAWEQINAQQGNVKPEDIYNIKDEIGGNLFEYFNRAYQYITGNKLVQDKNFVIPINQSSKSTTTTQPIVTQEVSKSDLEKLKQTPEGKKIEKERQEELKPYLVTSIDDKINIINENLGKMGFAGLANSPSIIFTFNEREPSTSFLQKPITKEGSNYRIITSRYNVLVDKDFNIISTTNVDTGKTYKYKESEIGNSIVEIGRVPDNFKVSQLIEQLFNENTAYKQNKQEEINKKYDEELIAEYRKQEVKPTPTVSNSIKNDLLNILEDIKRETDDESLNDNLEFPVVNASEFSGYPNIQKYLNTEYGIEQREYEFFKLHKDVVEDLLSSMKEVNPTNLLEKLKSVTDTNDTGVDSNIKPIITSDTKKDQELIKKANEQIKNTKYELFPGVGANVKQTEALDKLTDFLKAPIDKSEKTQSTFVLVGRGGTGKTTIVKKIVDEFPGSKVVGGAISHTAKNNLQKSLRGKTVRTIASLTGIGVFDDLNDFKDTTLSRADIIIIDECSMIDTATMNRIYQLANPNAKIIFMGDNVQLPPIEKNTKESPTFNAATKPENNAKLTKRMRQGEDSPIVPLSDIVAENIERSEKEIERKVIKRRDSNFNPVTNKGVIFTDNNAELMSNLERDFKADVQNTKIITYTNDEGKTGNPGNKKEMNGVVRKILWGADAKNEYNVGEILVADNIIYDANILNGEYYEVQGIKPINDAVSITAVELIPGKGIVTNQKKFPGYSLKVKVISETDNFNKIITLNLPSADSKQKIDEIQEGLKTANKSLFYQNKKIIPDVNYGYAITSHKAQGSTFNNTYVMEDNIINSGMSNKEANQALYVAMTRPRNKLVMFSELKEGEFLTEKQKENMVPTGESLQPEEIKLGVEELFNSNSELSSIGTPQQYSQYLNTIFPDSQVKDIVYHGTLNKFEFFDKSNLGINTFKDRPKGFYFTRKNVAEYLYGTFKQISQETGKEEFVKGNLISAVINTKEQYQLVQEKDDISGYGDFVEYESHVVFEPEQIHILGSKDDIKGFKEFVEKQSTQEVKEKVQETKKNTVSSAIENQIEELIKKGIIKSKCD